jgi:phosphate transport system substrate-binding protein
MKNLVALILMTLLVSACIPMAEEQPTPTVDLLAGRLTFAGSTTIQPLVAQLAEVYRNDHPNVLFDIAAGGSSVGIQAIHDGTADVGMVSRHLSEEELAGIDSFQIAIDVLAIVVNPGIPVDSLTLSQLQDIYLGRVLNWSELGGPDLAIVPIQRETTSGSRGAFDEIALEKQDASAPALLTAITAGDMAALVGSNPGAIGYLGFGNLDDSTRVIAINGVKPDLETARNGTYVLIRPLFLITGPLTQPLALSFIDFVLSPAGQEAVQAAGWIPVNE